MQPETLTTRELLNAQSMARIESILSHAVRTEKLTKKKGAGLSKEERLGNVLLRTLNFVKIARGLDKQAADMEAAIADKKRHAIFEN